MKVYRGYNKDIGPISYNDWIYVTPDLEQAKWYASRDGQIKNGEVIEYEISDKLNFLSIDDVNNIMANENEEYSINDLLWYQEGLTDYLYDYGAGIEFEDPKFKNHKIYIIFDKNYLKNGRIMKNNLNEAYIKAEKGNIYYTKNSDMFLSMVKSIFISNNKAVRVYYDTIKQMYVFGNAFDYIHADLANGMKYYSNIYGPDEMRANVSYLRQNCALFQVLPDDDFKKYDVGDGYTDGWFLKFDDLIFACRNKQYHKVRDNVPLFDGHIGEWQDVQYYEYKKSQQTVNESVEDKIIAYHGSQHKKFNFRDDKVLYLTTDKRKAESYAKREWDEGLIEGEIPVVYTFEISVKNPYVCHTENEFQSEFCDVNMNLEGGKEELIEKGYDSIKYKDLIGVFSSSQIKLVDTEVLPPSMDYYYPKDTKDGDEDINDYYYDEEELDESVNNKSELITAYRGIDSDKFKFKNGTPQWFSSSEGIAKSFGDTTFEVKLKLNNPADLTNDKELYIILKDMIKEYEESFRSRYNQIRGYLVDYIKETNPDFDLSDIDDNTLISLSKQLKDVPYYMESNIILFKELNFMLNDMSKNIAWAGFFHNFIYPNWNKVIKIIQNQGYDSIISYEEASDRSYIDIGYVIWNNENIVSIKKLNKNINESVEDKILYIIRGVPGSGKSTLAHKLTDNVVEADQYFYDDEGNYNWSADKLNQAHNWCYNTVKKYMEEGRDKIAVANTFVKNRDYKRYVELAKEFGYKVDIRTCTGNYQNIHNVPDETVEKMRSKFQETPLDESVKLVNKDLSDTKLITTPFEMNNYLKNNNETRFVYDTEKKWYLVGDAENSIHINLLNDALADGYYEPFEYNGKIINADSADLDAKAGKLLYQTNPNRFLLFRTSSDQLNGEDYYYDRYKYCYVYNNYCIFSRDINFEKTSLYKVLGKPNELEFIGDIDEDEGLNESIAYVSKKDLSDIILKNPTRKELKDNDLEFCRYMFEDDNTYYFVDAKEYSHLDLAQLFLDVFKNYNLHTDGGYYSVKENCFYIRNDFGCEKNKERLDNTKLLHKLFGNFKSIIYEGDYPEGYSKELDESAENDKTLRDNAVKLANIVLDAMVKTKYKSNLCTTQIQVFIDKEFKKAVPMLKKSPYEYVLLLTDKNDDPYPSYGKTPDRKYALITLPICNGNPCNGAIELLMKHKAMLNKIHRIYQGDELIQKIKETAIKYLKKEIEKKLKDYKGIFFEVLVHECTHLIDDLRRTKSYKSKEQKQSTENGQIDYYNSPEEQNAYYQETISAFDEWIKNEDWKKDWKNFNNFQNEFIRQYKGDYDKLNNINKRKLKKRIYAYWELYIKD